MWIYTRTKHTENDVTVTCSKTFQFVTHRTLDFTIYPSLGFPQYLENLAKWQQVFSHGKFMEFCHYRKVGTLQVLYEPGFVCFKIRVTLTRFGTCYIYLFAKMPNVSQSVRIKLGRPLGP